MMLTEQMAEKLNDGSRTSAAQ
jgi:hypothetical protein